MLIDSHCHLADVTFEPDLPSVVARAKSAGVSTALCILSADDADELVRADQVRGAWPDVQYAAGIHPHRSAPYAGRVEECVAVVRNAMNLTGAVAVGEIGLDYHYTFAPSDVQVAVFEAQVELAVSLGLPIVVHTREAAADTAAVLDRFRGRVHGVMHCFTGTADEAASAVARGFYLSFSGILTFPKADALRAIAASVPAERLLVETDAPYLAPVPHRGKRNEPAWVGETMTMLARVRGVAPEELRGQVASNFGRFLGREWHADAR